MHYMLADDKISETWNKQPFFVQLSFVMYSGAIYTQSGGIQCKKRSD